MEACKLCSLGHLQKDSEIKMKVGAFFRRLASRSVSQTNTYLIVKRGISPFSHQI